MTRIKHIFRQDAECLRYAALGDTAVRVLAIHHAIKSRDLDALIVPQNNPKLIPLWQAVFGNERIIIDPEQIGDEYSDARVSMPTRLDWAFGSAGWSVFEAVMWENAFFDTQRLIIDPPVTFPCQIGAKAAMIYPAEHTDGNRVFGAAWWLRTCEVLIEKGYLIHVLGDKRHSSLEAVLKSGLIAEYFEPSIEGLRSCTAASSIAIGSSTGPTWALLFSDIPQIVLESKKSPHGYWNFDRCQRVLRKRLRILPTFESLIGTL